MLCVGDIHIKPDNTHLVDLLEKQILNTVNSSNIEAIILLGDILHYHEKLHTMALNRACNLIDNLRKVAKVFVLVGNHDYIQNAQFLTTNHWMNALKEWENVSIVDKVTVTTLSEKSVFMLPYVPPQRFIEALQTVDDDFKKADYIFAHQEFRGCKMGAMLSTEGDQWNVEWPKVISGHIHDRQRPQENIYYVGCSIQNSFGDQTSPILLELPSWTEHVVTEMPKKKTIYINLEDKKPSDILESLEYSQAGQTRIVVSGESLEKFKNWKNAMEFAELENRGVKVVFKTNKTSLTHGHEDGINLSNAPIGFEENILSKLLSRGDSQLYCMYRKIFWDESELNPEDILIV